jgi:hypothetical protein
MTPRHQEPRGFRLQAIAVPDPFLPSLADLVFEFSRGKLPFRIGR